MTEERLENIAERVLYLEGYYLDTHRWEDWLNLFADDVIYWVPTWKSEYETTESPESELSLIYYTNKNGLEDRVVRATSGMSPASTPLPRTVHSASNIMVTGRNDDSMDVYCSWATYSYQTKNRSKDLLFGRCEYVLSHVGGEWKIARKKSTIVNEMLPSVVDVYHL